MVSIPFLIRAHLPSRYTPALVINKAQTEETTVIFLFLIFQYVSLSVTLSTGPPYRKPLYTNGQSLIAATVPTHHACAMAPHTFTWTRAHTHVRSTQTAHTHGHTHEHTHVHSTQTAHIPYTFTRTRAHTRGHAHYSHTHVHCTHTYTWTHYANAGTSCAILTVSWFSFLFSYICALSAGDPSVQYLSCPGTSGLGTRAMEAYADEAFLVSVVQSGHS